MFFDEWHQFDGRSREEIEAQLSGNLNRDRLPITFVAHQDAVLLGTVSLDLTDFLPMDHLSPWLASLYVDAPFRGRGVGRALVGHLQDFASSRGIGPLHLWTPGSTQLYLHCGWTVFASANYGGQPVTILRFEGEDGASPGSPWHCATGSSGFRARPPC